MHKVKQLDFDPFLLTDDIVNSTESEIEFAYDNTIYKHLISYNNDKVLIEKFWNNGKLIFSFDREKNQTIKEILKMVFMVRTQLPPSIYLEKSYRCDHNENGAYTNYSVNDKLYKLPFTKENNGTKIAQLYAKPFIEALKNGLI